MNFVDHGPLVDKTPTLQEERQTRPDPDPTNAVQEATATRPSTCYVRLLQTAGSDGLAWIWCGFCVYGGAIRLGVCRFGSCEKMKRAPPVDTPHTFML